MSFVRVKEIPPGSGNMYSYLVENIRDKDGNVKQKVLKYLGAGDHRKDHQKNIPSKKGRSIFYPSKSKYSEIVTIDSVPNAKKSIKQLDREWSGANKDKQNKLIKVGTLTANRIDAMQKKKNLSSKERKELKEVSKLYRDWVDKKSEEKKLGTTKHNPDKVQKALKHPDKPGAGAKKRKSMKLTPEEKFEVVMKEFKKGTLRSGSGEKVTKRNQALAIAFSESGLARSRKTSIRKIKKDKWEWVVYKPDGSVYDSGYSKSKTQAELLIGHHLEDLKEESVK